MKAQQPNYKRQPESDQSKKRKVHQPVSNELTLQKQEEALLQDNPFEPDMDRHVALLSKAYPEQRAQCILQLQQTYGNMYVQRLLNSMAVSTNLTVNEPGDVYEQEAERIADMAAGEPLLAKKEEEDEQERSQESLQMQNIKNDTGSVVVHQLGRGTDTGKDELRIEERPVIGQLQVDKLGGSSTVNGRAIPEMLAERIMHTKGTGEPVSSDVLHAANTHLGYDFGKVKVKSDTEAADLCQSLGARAFTHGADIWMGRGESVDDIKLMAHELTHVAQQGAAPKISAKENTNSKGKIQSQFERPSTGGIFQADETKTTVATEFPPINTMTGDSKVKAARDADWQAGKKDFLERFGWITWDTGSKKFEVTGRKTGDEFGVSPGPSPADTPPVYMVGHYHTHPPLSPKMKADQKEYRNNTGKEMFPIGPSGADKNFANGRNSPGVVEDFITALRWPLWLTWDFKYGPTKRKA